MSSSDLAQLAELHTRRSFRFRALAFIPLGLLLCAAGANLGKVKRALDSKINLLDENGQTVRIVPATDFRWPVAIVGANAKLQPSVVYPGDQKPYFLRNSQIETEGFNPSPDCMKIASTQKDSGHTAASVGVQSRLGTGDTSCVR